MITKSGLAVLIGSFVIDSAVLESHQTAFEHEGSGLGEELRLDDHVKYEMSQKLFGFLSIECLHILIFICKSRDQ